MIDYADLVQNYCDGVLDGRIVAGQHVRQAVARHVNDLTAAEARGLVFDRRIAEMACGFFPACLTHTKGEWAGKPFDLTPAQAFIVWTVFGWRKADSGMRRFRRAYITCGRKFGKSEFAAGLALLLTVCDHPLEPGADVYCAATKEEQALIVHNTAAEMVAQGPLRDYLECKRKCIKSVAAGALQPNSRFIPLGSNSRTQDGLNIHGVILDEIHEWGEHHRPLYEKLTTASGSRRQPLVVIITTAGTERSKIWNEIDEYAQAVLRGCDGQNPIGDDLFAYIARIDVHGDEKDDPFDPACWAKANPNYPVTPKHEFMASLAEEAMHSPPALQRFMRYNLNAPVSSSQRAIQPDLWNDCRAEPSDWTKADAVCGAWDLGGRDDLLAVGLVARFKDGVDEDGQTAYRYEIQARAWISKLTARDLTAEPFRSFIAAGQLICTTNELAEAKEYIRQCHNQYRVAKWAFDPHNSRDFEATLTQEGLKCDAFFQNTRMYNEPCKTFLAAMRKGQVTHDGNDLLTWCAGNMIWQENAKGEVMPDKGQSSDKIDPIVAVLMAFRLATLAPSKARGRLFVA
jgi:phage terminase large subunit-like protein